mgnify:CR=1 FL=1
MLHAPGCRFTRRPLIKTEEATPKGARSAQPAREPVPCGRLASCTVRSSWLETGRPRVGCDGVRSTVSRRARAERLSLTYPHAIHCRAAERGIAPSAWAVAQACAVPRQWHLTVGLQLCGKRDPPLRGRVMVVCDTMDSANASANFYWLVERRPRPMASSPTAASSRFSRSAGALSTTTRRCCPGTSNSV